MALGVFYLGHARFSDAVAPLEAFQHLQPGDAQGWVLLGQAYASSGQRERARETLNRGAELARRTGNARAEHACLEMLRQLDRSAK